MIARAKEALVERVGLGPVLNRKLQFLAAPSIPRLVAHERTEVRVAGKMPAAATVTIIPTVGRRTLLAAVESALAQVVTDHQVVVVTDGDCDLPSLPARVVIIRTTKSCGVPGVVRNIGIRATASRHIAFLDDDNTWHPNHLTTCLSRLYGCDAGLVYASAVRICPDGSRYDTVGQPWDRGAAARTNFVDTSAIVARRLPCLRFSRASRLNSQFAEDWDLVYRVSRSHTVAWTGIATVDYALSADLLLFLEHLKGAQPHPPRCGW